jgi:hypothetical protein
MSFKEFLIEKQEGMSALNLERYVPIFWNYYSVNGGDAQKYNLAEAIELAASDKVKLSVEEFHELTNERIKTNILKVMSKYIPANEELLFTGNEKTQYRESKKWIEYKNIIKYTPSEKGSDTTDTKQTKAVTSPEKLNSTPDSPKTDFISKHRTSKIYFCKLGGTMFLFAGPEESGATFLAAQDMLIAKDPTFLEKVFENGTIKKQVEEINNNIKKNLTSLTTTLNRTKTTEKLTKLNDLIKKQEKEPTLNKDELKKAIEDRDATKKDFEKFVEIENNTKQLVDQIVKTFTSSPELKQYVVYEAISGATKFRDTPDGIANLIMGIEPINGKTVVAKLDEKFCLNFAKTVNVSVAFKTSQSTHHTKSTASLKVRPNTTVPDQEIKNIEYGKTGQTEEIVKESFENDLNRLYEDAYLYEGIMDIVTAVIHWGKKFWEKLKELLKQGIDKLLEYFGIPGFEVTITPAEVVLSADMF